MNHKKYILFASFLVVLWSCSTSKSAIQETQTVTVEQKVENLLQKMTLQEKVGQMAQITLDVITKGNDRFSSYEPIEINEEEFAKIIQKYQIGSVLNTANNKALSLEKWQEITAKIQHINTEKSINNIPILYGIDAIHGATYTDKATFFPQQIGLAATFNTALVEKAAALTAYETRASNIHWNFSPVLDLGRDARFPRMWETFGEDVYLTSEMGKAFVLGYQGDVLPLPKDKVIACLKHYVGYGVSNAGKDRTPLFLPENELRERYLEPFKQAVNQGALTVMVNSGIINSLPVHANKYLLTDVLKSELNFKGFTVTDWADIENLHKRDKVAQNDREAIKIAINAGIDMAMIPYNYETFCDNLIDLVQKNEVPETRINDAVRRILRVKFLAGLFEKNTLSGNEYPEFASKNHERIAYQTALESITLLKNEPNILPLHSTQKVLIVGPNAHSMRTLNGGWSYSWQGEKVEQFAQKYNTIVEAIEQKIGKENVQFEAGVFYKNEGKYFEENTTDFSNIISKAAQADVIIACIGENSYTEKPGDLNDLNLSYPQKNLVLALAKTNKPIVLILNQGRPRLIRELVPVSQAIVQLYLPGNFGGDALADLLFGTENFSGKLPFTYPKFANSLLTYDHKPSENQEKMVGAYDYESDVSVQFEFGTGLSYTTFQYSNLKINKKEFNSSETIEIQVDITNTGTKIGKETTLLFSKDLYATLTPDVKRLRRFQKTELQPNETQTIRFSLPIHELQYINHENKRTAENGIYQLQIQNLITEIELKN